MCLQNKVSGGRLALYPSKVFPDHAWKGIFALLCVGHVVL